MKLRASITAVLTSIFIVCCAGQQQHMLKVINTGSNPPPSTPAQFSSAQPNNHNNVRQRFANADRICVSGIWALYNTTFFGEGAEDSTTVISIRGTDINTCTQRGQIPVLKNVQSVRYMGNADYMSDGMIIYAQPYLLGGYWNVVDNTGTVTTLPAYINGFPLGSIAITGTSAWIICGDTSSPCSNGVCVNMQDYGKLFLQRNALKDTSNGANIWPRTVRQVVLTTAAECSNYPSPALLNQKRLFKRNAVVEGVEEVSVYTPPST